MESFLSTSLLQNLSYAFLILGALCMLIGMVMILIQAGRTDGAWLVLLILICGCIGLATFLIRHPGRARIPFLVWLLGIALMGAGLFTGTEHRKLLTVDQEIALASDPENPRNLDDLAISYYYAQRLDESLELMKKAIRNKRDLAKVCEGNPSPNCAVLESERYIVRVYNELERYREALVSWNRYMRGRSDLSHTDQIQHSIALHGAGRKREGLKLYLELCYPEMEDPCTEHLDRFNADLKASGQ